MKPMKLLQKQRGFLFLIFVVTVAVAGTAGALTIKAIQVQQVANDNVVNKIISGAAISEKEMEAGTIARAQQFRIGVAGANLINAIDVAPDEYGNSALAAWAGGVIGNHVDRASNQSPASSAPLPIDVATPIKLDLDAEPTQVTRVGSFIVKTWGGTTMDSFRIGGGELTSASFFRTQGMIIYNVKGTFKPGQTVSLAVTGSQWDMSMSMVGLIHNHAMASIRYLDGSGKLIGETIENDTGKSKSPSLSASVSGSVPAGATTAIMEGQFDCTWASAYTTASETAGVKVTLTVEK